MLYFVQVRYATPPTKIKQPKSLRSKLNAFVRPESTPPTSAQTQHEQHTKPKADQGGEQRISSSNDTSYKEQQVVVLKRVLARRGWEVKQSGVREGYFGRLLKQEHLQLCCRLSQHATLLESVTQEGPKQFKAQGEVEGYPCPELEEGEGRLLYRAALRHCEAALRVAVVPGGACPSLTGNKAPSAASTATAAPGSGSGNTASPAAGAAAVDGTAAGGSGAAAGGGSGNTAAAAATAPVGGAAATASVEEGQGELLCDEDLLSWLPGVVLGHKHLVQFEEGFEMPCSGDVWLVFQVSDFGCVVRDCVGEWVSDSHDLVLPA